MHNMFNCSLKVSGNKFNNIVCDKRTHWGSLLSSSDNIKIVGLCLFERSFSSSSKWQSLLLFLGPIDLTLSILDVQASSVSDCQSQDFIFKQRRLSAGPGTIWSPKTTPWGPPHMVSPRLLKPIWTTISASVELFELLCFNSNQEDPLARSLARRGCLTSSYSLLKLYFITKPCSQVY